MAEQIGDLAPCGAPAVATGLVWYSACDDGLMVRIDPTTNEPTTIVADGLEAPLAVDDVLYASGPEGLVRFDAATETWAVIGGCCGYLAGYGDGTMWLSADEALLRVDPATGAIAATIPLGGAGNVAFAAGAAWTTAYNDNQLKEIDLQTNEITEHGPLGPSPGKVLVVGNVLWVTDFGTSQVWRITLPD